MEIQTLSLKDLLSKIDKNTNTKEIKEIFEKIAEKLFNEYHIQKGKRYYDFAEIEFYIYSPKHKDITTYTRNTKAGDWFFHMSGVDLSFESKIVNNTNEQRDANEDVFGGILIRSLRDQDGNIIAGPYKCVDLLFDQFNALQLDRDNYPIIVEKNKCKDEYLKTTRWLPPFCGDVNEEKSKEKIKTHINKKFGCAPDKEPFNNNDYTNIISDEYRYFLKIDTEKVKIKYSNTKANPWKQK